MTSCRNSLSRMPLVFRACSTKISTMVCMYR
jgi:hypothetical protein